MVHSERTQANPEIHALTHIQTVPPRARAHLRRASLGRMQHQANQCRPYDSLVAGIIRRMPYLRARPNLRNIGGAVRQPGISPGRQRRFPGHVCERFTELPAIVSALRTEVKCGPWGQRDVPMAHYKYPQLLQQVNTPAYDQLHHPGNITPDSGIYRCEVCGWEVVSERGNPFPPPNHHTHPGFQPIKWRLAA